MALGFFVFCNFPIAKKYAPFEYKEEVLKICNVDIFALNKNLAQGGAF